MNFDTYLINNREYTGLLPLAKEFDFHPEKNYLFDLSYLAMLSVIGVRAEEFLQGQLSCDIRQVSPAVMRQGAMCNLKGRILALLDVIQWHQFQLILPKDLLSDTKNSLAKTAMLSRVILEPAYSYQIYGFYLNNPDDLLPGNIRPETARFAAIQTEEFCCYSLGHNLFIFLIKQEKIPSFINTFKENQQIRGSLAWHYLQLTHKQVQIYPQTRGLFLPHRLDLHLSGHLNFNKGCYKGQEIIARTHYRAKLKHGLRLFTIETEKPLHTGQKLLEPSSGVEIGELVDFCPLGAQQHLIAASILFEHPAKVHIENHKDPVKINPVIKQ
ncbi:MULTISPECIES: folate-binding protein YgfZ [unclassified Legionella]|uniref:CAF17-like 4Fe-4S cluster assembly/insertion protein YgfZ n=1 Tax=unclassified Legionella TaxID=2622702 RepID=UPI0010562D10|nr:MULTISPECIES: folate-binding protein YgfZ [unclassified Legionella]MDI9819452.1 folate-binding protein YgfZ [Legionella sp. PL877]